MGTDVPLKVIPLAAVSVSLFSTSIQLAVSYVVLLVILIMGGVTSLVLSQALPNQLKRLKIKEQLEELMIATSNLTDHLDSKLLVLVRLERSRLFDMLSSRTVFSPEFANIVTQCFDGAEKLRGRVELLKQMDVVCGRVAKSLTSGVAPSLVRGVTDDLQTAAVMLAKSALSAAEMDDARVAIERASTQVGSLTQPADSFGNTLAKRVAEIKAEVTASLLNLPTWIRIVQVVPGPWNQVQSFSGDIVPQGQLVSLDFAVEKMLRLRDYVLLKEGANDPDMSQRLQQREPELLRLMQLTSHEGLQAAQRLVRQMSEDQAPAQLMQAIQAEPDEATIGMEPRVAYDRAPLEFSICFYNRALNVAAAKEEWTCEWDFGDGITSKGWSVAHYFRFESRSRKERRPRDYVVSARFHNQFGKPVVCSQGQPVTISRTVTVRPTLLGSLFGDRAWTEGVKLAVALLIAVFGLVAGASEQLGKLDLLPGVVAVFLLGFGADTIKNLLTSNS